MTSNIFTPRQPRQRPPPYCKKPPEDLPIIPLVDPPMYLQGYATLLDHDPLAYNDIAAYFQLRRLGTSWVWTETLDMGHCRFSLTIARLADPQPWTVTIAVPDPPLYAFTYSWPPFELPLVPTWDTGHLTMSWPPVYDKVTARCTA